MLINLAKDSFEREYAVYSTILNNTGYTGSFLSEIRNIFNSALSKMRIATSAVVENNEPLMKTLVKIMYDFSDELRREELIKDKDDGKSRQNSTVF